MAGVAENNKHNNKTKNAAVSPVTALACSSTLTTASKSMLKKCEGAIVLDTKKTSNTPQPQKHIRPKVRRGREGCSGGGGGKLRQVPSSSCASSNSRTIPAAASQPHSYQCLASPISADDDDEDDDLDALVERTRRSIMGLAMKKTSTKNATATTTNIAMTQSGKVTPSPSSPSPHRRNGKNTDSTRKIVEEKKKTSRPHSPKKHSPRVSTTTNDGAKVTCDDVAATTTFSPPSPSLVTVQTSAAVGVVADDGGGKSDGVTTVVSVSNVDAVDAFSLTSGNRANGRGRAAGGGVGILKRDGQCRYQTKKGGVGQTAVTKGRNTTSSSIVMDIDTGENASFASVKKAKKTKPKKPCVIDSVVERISPRRTSHPRSRQPPNQNDMLSVEGYLPKTRPGSFVPAARDMTKAKMTSSNSITSEGGGTTCLPTTKEAENYGSEDSFPPHSPIANQKVQGDDVELPNAKDVRFDTTSLSAASSSVLLSSEVTSFPEVGDGTVRTVGDLIFAQKKAATSPFGEAHGRKETSNDKGGMEEDVVEEVDVTFACMTSQEYDETINEALKMRQRQVQQGKEKMGEDGKKNISDKKEDEDEDEDDQENSELGISIAGTRSTSSSTDAGSNSVGERGMRGMMASSVPPVGFVYQYEGDDIEDDDDGFFVEQQQQEHVPETFPSSSPRHDERRAIVLPPSPTAEPSNVPGTRSSAGRRGRWRGGRDGGMVGEGATAMVFGHGAFPAVGGDEHTEDEYDNDEEHDDAIMAQLGIVENDDDDDDVEGEYGDGLGSIPPPTAFLRLWDALSGWATPEACRVLRQWRSAGEDMHNEDDRGVSKIGDDTVLYVVEGMTGGSDAGVDGSRSDVEASRCGGLMSMLKMHIPKCLSEIVRVEVIHEDDDDDEGKARKEGGRSEEDTLIRRRTIESLLGTLVQTFDYSRPMVDFDRKLLRAMTVILISTVTMNKRNSDSVAMGSKVAKSVEEKADEQQKHNDGQHRLPDSIKAVGLTREEYSYLCTSAILSLNKGAG